MSKDIIGMDPNKFKNIKKAFETNTIGKANFDEPSNKVSFDILLNKWKDIQQPVSSKSSQLLEQQIREIKAEESKPTKKKIIKKIVKKKIIIKKNDELL